MNARADINGREHAAALEPIAIIGMACLFPQAPDLASFWRNIVSGVDAISEPAAAWDADRYLRSGSIKTAFGGYLKELFRFDPREFGIMPNSLDGGEPDQFVALRIARDALADAGYLNDYDHRDTGIVLGHSTYLHRGQVTVIQQNIVLDQTMDLLGGGLSHARRWPAGRDALAAEGEAAAEQRRRRAGAGAQRHDRPHRQPAKPARDRTTFSTPRVRRRCWLLTQRSMSCAAAAAG
jgi:hypothetical protein